MRIGPRSLAFRIVAFSTAWAVLSLVVIATIISALYREASERGFDSTLSAYLFNLIGSVDVSEGGALQGAPELGDIAFVRPESGWYWAVEPVSDALSGILRSPSMTAAIPSPEANDVAFDSQFRRRYRADGIAGEEIEVLESEIVLDEQNRVARFRIMGNRTELEARIADFEASLYLYLALFGIGLIGINAIAILIGLRPLDRVRDALARVRDGTARKLSGTFPSEIQPLASETNALIENNRRIVERARTQVGNLAHSLKTPLSVAINEARALGGEKGRLIEEQVASMRDQVEHYLQRARIAAQRDSVVFRTPVVETLTRIVRVMRKLNPRLEIGTAFPSGEIAFAGEREDLEEIAGNLMDNAMKWGRERVRVSVRASGGGDESSFELLIEDDGPGIPEDQAREALKRGRRLDESKPGTGLGLAIVADLVAEYSGRIELDRSPLGGLRVTIEMRQAT